MFDIFDRNLSKKIKPFLRSYDISINTTNKVTFSCVTTIKQDKKDFTPSNILKNVKIKVFIHFLIY